MFPAGIVTSAGEDGAFAAVVSCGAVVGLSWIAPGELIVGFSAIVSCVEEDELPGAVVGVDAPGAVLLPGAIGVVVVPGFVAASVVGSVEPELVLPPGVVVTGVLPGRTGMVSVVVPGLDEAVVSSGLVLLPGPKPPELSDSAGLVGLVIPGTSDSEGLVASLGRMLPGPEVLPGPVSPPGYSASEDSTVSAADPDSSTDSDSFVSADAPSDVESTVASVLSAFLLSVGASVVFFGMYP